VPGRSCLAKADMLGWTDPETPPDTRRDSAGLTALGVARRTLVCPDATVRSSWRAFTAP